MARQNEKKIWFGVSVLTPLLRRLWIQVLDRTRASVQERRLGRRAPQRGKVETGGIAIQALGSNKVRNEPNIITCCDTPFSRMPISTLTHPPPEQDRMTPPTHTHSPTHRFTFFPGPLALFRPRQLVDSGSLGEANRLRYQHDSDRY